MIPHARQSPGIGLPWTLYWYRACNLLGQGAIGTPPFTLLRVQPRQLFWRQAAALGDRLAMTGENPTPSLAYQRLMGWAVGPPVSLLRRAGPMQPSCRMVGSGEQNYRGQPVGPPPTRLALAMLLGGVSDMASPKSRHLPGYAVAPRRAGQCHSTSASGDS